MSYKVAILLKEFLPWFGLLRFEPFLQGQIACPADVVFGAQTFHFWKEIEGCLCELPLASKINKPFALACYTDDWSGVPLCSRISCHWRLRFDNSGLRHSCVNFEKSELCALKWRLNLCPNSQNYENKFIKLVWSLLIFSTHSIWNLTWYIWQLFMFYVLWNIRKTSSSIKLRWT